MIGSDPQPRPQKRSSTGRFVRCAEGYLAFVPNPLPPKIAWTQKLVNALSAADRAIGRLSGEAARLPNPNLLIHPFVRREAVLSSRIEGTQATLGELLAVEAGAAAVKGRTRDLQEVRNYVEALEYGVEHLANIPLSLRLIRKLHEMLMQGVRGGQAAPGDFRRSQNWIGPPGSTLAQATYVPPPPLEMQQALGDWEGFLHTQELPPLIQIALAHYQFEAIHPFIDGNGRVGRLLITLFLVERDILPNPLLYLSAYFAATRQEYYARLLAVSEQGEWSAWLLYFLRGVARQAEDVAERSTRIWDLLTVWRQAIAGSGSPIPARLVERLAHNPFWTINGIAKDLNVAYTTAKRAVNKLVAHGILTPLDSSKRDRVYCAAELMDILEEPPSLS